MTTTVSNLTSNNTAPATDALAVTPSDTVNFTKGECRGLWVGGNGNVVAVFPNGSAITLSGVIAGTLLPISIIRVNSTSTTATLMVALY